MKSHVVATGTMGIGLLALWVLISGPPARPEICEGHQCRGRAWWSIRMNRSPDFMSYLLSLLKALLNHNQIIVNRRFLLKQESPLASLLTALLSGDSFTTDGAGDCPGHRIWRVPAFELPKYYLIRTLKAHHLRTNLFGLRGLHRLQIP